MQYRHNTGTESQPTNGPPAAPLALHLSATLLEKRNQRHPRRKLNAIHGHDTPSLETLLDRLRLSVAQLVSGADLPC
jgi:hypothetical protein